MSLSITDDFAFQQETADDNTVRWLSRSYKALMLACIFQCVFQLFLVVWAFTQCTTILGLSLSGKIFYADSFTCPFPGIEKLYPHN